MSSPSFKDTKILLFSVMTSQSVYCLVLAYCLITIKLYQIDGQHIDGEGGCSCGNCHRICECPSYLQTYLCLPLNVMTLMAKYHKKKAN